MTKPLPISKLLEKASAAIPAKRSTRCEWSRFEPVIAQLRANGFNLEASVSWLVEQGQITQAEETKAYKSLSRLQCRRRKKEQACVEA